jgi:uncharacterized metal-binding protein YceD (DUF177 family)
MAKEMPYQVLVRELPTHRTFEVPPALVGEWIKGLPMRDALDAPDGDPEAGHGTADLELYADGAHAFATGTFRGELTVACSRCITPVKLILDETLRVTFMPRHELPSDDDAPGARKSPDKADKTDKAAKVEKTEKSDKKDARNAKAAKAAKDAKDAEADEGPEIADEDLDLFPFDGETIDLEPLFREQFVLAIPYAPLCSETCKGLCQQCGIDRNTATCTCEPPIDPRLAGLKGLKIPS